MRKSWRSRVMVKSTVWPVGTSVHPFGMLVCLSSLHVTCHLLLFQCSSSSFSMDLLCLYHLFLFSVRLQLFHSSPRSIASVSRFMLLRMEFCCMQIFSGLCQCHRQETATVCSVDSSEQSNCFNQISKQTA